LLSVVPASAARPSRRHESHRHRLHPPIQPECLNANQPGLREFNPSIDDTLITDPGRVLPGRTLVSQLPNTPPYVDPNPLLANYPNGQLPTGPLRWENVLGLPPSSLVYASNADAIFNAENARYRIAFNQSYFGVDPRNIGDFGGTGVDDLAIPSHYAYVDGTYQAGEVDIYYGRHHERIDPTKAVPDVILYGDQLGGKFGISVAPAGDVNGDGREDLLVAAAFHSAPGPDGTTIPEAGEVYLLYGGYLDRFRCPVKVRAQDIGTTVPGIVFYGGGNGALLTGWANELDSGDFNGDGLSDIVIGAYNPYATVASSALTYAYVIYGSRSLPRHLVGYRLGVDTNRDGIRSTIYTLPSELTNASLGFSAAFVGDLTGNGDDDLAFGAALAGANSRGEDFIFFAPPPPGQTVVPIQGAPLTIYADDLASPELHFAGLDGVRPNGDVYGDGHQDALLTARYTRDASGKYVGAVGVLEGRSHFPPTLAFSQLNTIIYGDQLGNIGQPAMATGADFNGDGCTDILINSTDYRESIGGTVEYRGRMWLLLGRPNLPSLVDLEPSADRTIVANTELPGLFGFNWDTGDFDGDGRPDLVVADHYSGDAQLHDFAGRTYLFYNHSLNLPWNPPPDGCHGAKPAGLSAIATLARGRAKWGSR
jgi:hypothetical protein